MRIKLLTNTKIPNMLRVRETLAVRLDRQRDLLHLIQTSFRTETYGTHTDGIFSLRPLIMSEHFPVTHAHIHLSPAPALNIWLQLSECEDKCM